MSVTVSFLDEDRTMISDHGDTGIEDGMPVFGNSSVVGHFTEGFIDDVEINGVSKRCVLGKGYIDEMRYKSFVETLETQINNGNSVDGSIEIYKAEGNEGIVYKKGYLPKGRIPVEFIHSGWAMVVNPADINSTLLELNTQINKEEEKILNEKELRDLIQSTISETNSKNEELNKKITELNSTISEKDSVIAEKEQKISELNATVEQAQKALDDFKSEQETYRTERSALEKELGELKSKARLAELNTAIEDFSDEEKKFAESEINSFNENPLEGNIDDIVSKIYAGIGKGYKENEENNRTSECNSSNDDLDIFAEINSVEDNDDDTNIF